MDVLVEVAAPLGGLEEGHQDAVGLAGGEVRAGLDHVGSVEFWERIGNNFFTNESLLLIICHCVIVF